MLRESADAPNILVRIEGDSASERKAIVLLWKRGIRLESPVMGTTWLRFPAA